MEDLLSPQIRESCRLAIPEGLNELMTDISREVLRTQPENLYQFIRDYLAALLVTRDNLSIAAYICRDIYQCGCDPELQHELEDLGLNEEDATTAKEIIVKYLEKGSVNEGQLLSRLMKHTSIDEKLMPAVQDVIRIAFLRHQAHNTSSVFESSSDSDQDSIKCAVKHTLNLYKKTKPSEEIRHIMAQKIQAAYRAYGVRRKCLPKDMSVSQRLKSTDKTVILLDQESYDSAFPRTEHSYDSLSDVSWPMDAELAITESANKKRVTTMSSTCLAGSFVHLPTHTPYSAHDCDALSDLEEIPEKECAYLDYTADNPHLSLVAEDKLYVKRESSKKISFSDSLPDALKKLGLEVQEEESLDSISRASFERDVDQNESSMTMDRNSLNRSNDKKNDINYDGDVEVDPTNSYDGSSNDINDD